MGTHLLLEALRNRLLDLSSAKGRKPSSGGIGMRRNSLMRIGGPLGYAEVIFAAATRRRDSPSILRRRKPTTRGRVRAASARGTGLVYMDSNGLDARLLRRRSSRSRCSLLPGPRWRSPRTRQSDQVIVPFAPGGASDVVARIMASKLADVLGQQIVIENRAGRRATSAWKPPRGPRPTATRCSRQHRHDRDQSGDLRNLAVNPARTSSRSRRSPTSRAS